MFLYDRYPGGLGFSEKGYGLYESLMEECLATISTCPCEEGCPSCVGLPVTQPAQQMDPDLGRGYPIPDKEAALVLLHHLLGLEAYVPRKGRRRRGSEEGGGELRQQAATAARATEATRETPESVSVAEQVAERLRRRRKRVGL